MLLSAMLFHFYSSLPLHHDPQISRHRFNRWHWLRGTLIFQSNVPHSSVAASSSNPSSASQFKSQGVTFRHVDYNDRAVLREVFQGAENLLFVSSNTFDHKLRIREQRNVVDAAKKVGIGHVWYTSLAFGEFGDHSNAAVQQAHIATEKLLEESGITFTSIREGIYTEAFPLFLGWYPSTEVVYLPSDGPVAYTSRAELAKETAKIMIEGGFGGEKVLLTAQKAYTLSELVSIINTTTKRKVHVKFVREDEYAKKMERDEGGKPETLFKAILTWYEGFSRGEGATTDPLMAKLLGREPNNAKEVLGSLLEEDKYRWHQCYVNKAGAGYLYRTG